MTACHVVAEGLQFPEGPAFDQDAHLWAVEVEGGALTKFRDGGVHRIAVGGMPNGLAFRAGAAWFCDAEGCSIRRLEQDGSCSSVITAVEGVAPDRPNDLAFDRLGNLVFTCPGNSRLEPTGSVWCRRVDGAVKKIADGLFFPNGLAFDTSGERLIIAETYRHRLWNGAWDEASATWHGGDVWAQTLGPVGPDGMAFGPGGNLHVAIFGQGIVSEINSDGLVVRQLAVPGRRPTNVAFDPRGELGMVVTEAELGRMLSYPGYGAGTGVFSS